MTAVLVAGGTEVLLFDSAEAAERYMEPPDVREGEYDLAVDLDGRRLNIEIESNGRWLPVERVRLRAVPDSAPQPEVVRELLVRLLQIHGESRATGSTEPIGALLVRASRFKTK